MSKTRLCLPALCIILLVLGACDSSQSVRRVQGAVWGTMYHITYIADRDLSDSIVYQMRLIDMSLSPFEPSSLVSRINAGETVTADSLLVEVIGLSQQVSRLSRGAFDPTVAPLVNLWGFGYRDGADDIPADAAIDSALATVGIMQCSIGADGTVIKKHRDTEFNFSAVAKGLGVDRIAAMLRRNGCTDYLVEVGGEIALSGNSPGRQGWVIQIDAPVDDNTGASHQQMQLLHTTDICIATSGNYRNYRETSQGRAYHTINPTTGRPVKTNTLSVTILAGTTALADALATAVMAMPVDSATAMLSRLDGVEALIAVDETTQLKIITTDRFASHLE